MGSAGGGSDGITGAMESPPSMASAVRVADAHTLNEHIESRTAC